MRLCLWAATWAPVTSAIKPVWKDCKECVKTQSAESKRFSDTNNLSAYQISHCMKVREKYAVDKDLLMNGRDYRYIRVNMKQKKHTSNFSITMIFSMKYCCMLFLLVLVLCWWLYSTSKSTDLTLQQGLFGFLQTVPAKRRIWKSIFWKSQC